MTLRRADRRALELLAGPELSVAELAELTALKGYDVRNFLHARGLEWRRVKRGRKPRADPQAALHLRRAGCTLAQIGQRLGVSAQRVHQIVNTARRGMPPPGR